jgi:hypothetical protein
LSVHAGTDEILALGKLLSTEMDVYIGHEVLNYGFLAVIRTHLGHPLI